MAETYVSAVRGGVVVFETAPGIESGGNIDSDSQTRLGSLEAIAASQYRAGA